MPLRNRLGSLVYRPLLTAFLPCAFFRSALGAFLVMSILSGAALAEEDAGPGPGAKTLGGMTGGGAEDVLGQSPVRKIPVRDRTNEERQRSAHAAGKKMRIRTLCTSANGTRTAPGEAGYDECVAARARPAVNGAAPGASTSMGISTGQ